jgi:Bacterial regulatory proteins, tetR family
MAATRQRITEVAIELHGTVGPARTTLSAVAKQAGVQRHTVYRHFPTEADLFDACRISTSWCVKLWLDPVSSARAAICVHEKGPHLQAL